MSYSRPFDVQDSRPLSFGARNGAADKLLGLELLRFAAALAVLFNHYRFFAHMAGMPSIERGSFPVYAALWPLYDYGHYGVQIFWGISGYIFFWKYGSAISSGSVSPRNFFWLRFSRLYPLHFATLMTVVGLQALHRHMTSSDFFYPAQDAGLFLRHLFLASDWTSISYSFNGPIWSVSAEIAVYGAFFMLLRLVVPSISLCAGAVVATLLFTLAGIDWISLTCATYFFAGGLAALAPGEARRAAGPVLLALLLVWAVMGVQGDVGKAPMILLLALPCLLLVLTRDRAWLARWQRPAQALANLTYASYLLHFPLQLILAIAVAASGWSPDITGWGFFASWLTITLGAAYACYRWFEVPAQAWIRQRTIRR